MHPTTANSKSRLLICSLPYNRLHFRVIWEPVRVVHVQLRVKAAADLQRHGRGVPEHPGQAAGRAVQGERRVTEEPFHFISTPLVGS